MLPSRAFTVSIEPSTFSIVPRTRTGGVVAPAADACANAIEVANRTPTAAAPSIRRVILVIIIILPTCSQFRRRRTPRRLGFETPRYGYVIPERSPAEAEIGLDRARSSAVTSGFLPNHSAKPRTA